MATIMVLGAGAGIGFETARRFAREGFDVVLASRDPSKLGASLKELRDAGTKVTTEIVDASDGRSVTALVERYADGLDVLLYNAAALRYGPVIDALDPETFDSDIQTGISSAMRAIKSALSSMTARGRGTILLTGGSLSDNPDPKGLTLSVAKAGIRSIAQALFQDTKEKGIYLTTLTVRAGVEPGSRQAREIAEQYWQMYASTEDTWKFEHDYNG